MRGHNYLTIEHPLSPFKPHANRLTFGGVAALMNFLQKIVRETAHPFRQFGGVLRGFCLFIFSRPRFQKLNDRILNKGLKAKGYHNNLACFSNFVFVSPDQARPGRSGLS
jgi:hypothetical protein